MNFYDVALSLYLYLADIQIQIKKMYKDDINSDMPILELIFISIFI